MESEDEGGARVSEASTRRRQYEIRGMDCPNCARKVSEAVRALPGVAAADVDFMSGHLEVSFQEDDSASAQVESAVGRAGYRASLKEDTEGHDAGPPSPTRGRQLRWVLVAGAAFAWVVGLVTSVLGRDGLSAAPYWIAILLGGLPIAFNALRALRHRRLNIDVLMTVAVVGAVGLGEYGEASAVVVLFAASELLESYSVSRTRDAIRSLLAGVPSVVTLRRGDGLVDVPVGDASIGEVLVVRPGARVALDATVIGEAVVNEAPITGESRPVDKNAGDVVYAGSVNETSAFEATITRTADDTELARILRLARQAQRARARVERMVDRFAAYYTPAILACAALLVAAPVLVFGAPFGDWLYRGLVVLVVGCPCALVLSTPVTMVSALARGASLGILVKGGVHLETLARARAVALDKTGTLTEGVMEVSDVIVAGTADRTDTLRIAAAVLSRSEHAIGQAVVEAASSSGVGMLPEAVGFAAYPGRGGSAEVNGTRYVVGSARLFDELGIPRESLDGHLRALGADGKTATLLGTESGAIACFGLSDRVRDEAPEVIDGLRRLGIAEIVMLTGDQEAVALEVRAKTGVDAHYAGLLPEEKLEHISRLEDAHGQVAMVGDGINDAPALAGATIGIAMGGIGTAAAIEAGDVMLVGDDLRKLPRAFGLARAALRIVKWNIAFSVATKLLILVLAAMDLATLWAAVLADVGVSLAVVVNGMRMLRWEPRTGRRASRGQAVSDGG